MPSNDDPTSVRALAKKHGIDLSRVKESDEFELETGKPFLSDLVGEQDPQEENKEK